MSDALVAAVAPAQTLNAVLVEACVNAHLSGADFPLSTDLCATQYVSPVAH